MRDHTSADDEWLRAEELTHCQEKVAEYDAAAPRRPAARRADPAAAPAAARPAAPAPAPAPLGPPAGFRLAASSEVLSGTALVGQAVLYRCPVEGRVLGWVLMEGWVLGTLLLLLLVLLVLGPRHGGRSQPGRRVLARGAVRPHMRPRDVVRYGRTCALGSAGVPSLLDAASHGPAGRWVLLRRVAR